MVVDAALREMNAHQEQLSIVLENRREKVEQLDLVQAGLHLRINKQVKTLVSLGKDVLDNLTDEKVNV